MSETDFEALVAEREKQLSEKDKFDARLGRLTDHQFEAIKHDMIRGAELAKARAEAEPEGQPLPDELSFGDALDALDAGPDLAAMNDRELLEYSRSFGNGMGRGAELAGFQPTLSDEINYQRKTLLENEE